MIARLNLSDFCDAFTDAGRKSQFSHEALELLFDYFEEMDSCTILDVVAICCKYSEWSAGEVTKYYGLDEGQEVSYYLADHTTLVGKTDEGFVFASF